MSKPYPVHAWGCRGYSGKAAGAKVPTASASLIAKSSVGDAKGIPCTQPLSPTVGMHVRGLHWETWERQGGQDPPADPEGGCSIASPPGCRASPEPPTSSAGARGYLLGCMGARAG